MVWSDAGRDSRAKGNWKMLICVGEYVMNRLGTYNTSTLSWLMVVGTLVPCHTHASDRAVIEVRGESEAEVMWFRPDAVMFTDRGYRLSGFPEAMAGEIERKTGVPIVSITYDGTGGNKNDAIIPYLKFPRTRFRDHDKRTLQRGSFS